MVDSKTLTLALMLLASCSFRDERGILRMDHPSEGLRLLREGRTSEALERLKHEKAMGNRNPHVAWGLGRAHAMEGHLRLSRDEYERALLMAPAMEEASFDLAALDYAQGRLTECLMRLEAMPLGDSAAWNRVLVLLKLRQGDKALAAARILVGISPEKAPHWELLGLTALAQGEFTEACLAFERLLKLDPGNACALGNIERIRQGGEGVPTAPTHDVEFQDAHGASGWIACAEEIPGDRSAKRSRGKNSP